MKTLIILIAMCVASYSQTPDSGRIIIADSGLKTSYGSDSCKMYWNTAWAAYVCSTTITFPKISVTAKWSGTVVSVCWSEMSLNYRDSPDSCKVFRDSIVPEPGTLARQNILWSYSLPSKRRAFHDFVKDSVTQLKQQYFICVMRVSFDFCNRSYEDYFYYDTVKFDYTVPSRYKLTSTESKHNPVITQQLASIFDISGRLIATNKDVNNWKAERNGVFIARFNNGNSIKFVRMK